PAASTGREVRKKRNIRKKVSARVEPTCPTARTCVLAGQMYRCLPVRLAARLPWSSAPLRRAPVPCCQHDRLSHDVEWSRHFAGTSTPWLSHGGRTRRRAERAMTAAFTVPKLLEHAGARLVSNRRANCPRCGTKRTVSYTDEVFNCHHAGCDFKGNVFTLAKELGLAQRIPHSEIQRQRREREHVRRQGEALAERIGERVKALARAERVL